MGNIILENEDKCKTRITLEDCEIGDIVLLNKEIYLVIEGGCDTTFFVLVNLNTGEQKEFYYNIECSRYTKTLRFNVSDFQEYKYID